MKAARSILSTLAGTLAGRDRHDRGAAAVEFALILPVVLAALTGIANYGLAMYNKMELAGAVRAGAQVALLSASATEATIKQAVVDSTNVGITTSDVTTTQFCECDGTLMAACSDSCPGTKRTFMTISVTQNFTLLLLGTTVALDASTTVRTQ